MAATVRDVAHAAGVSIATVSVVVNGTAGRFRIAPATRERVLARAAELGYVADARVRGLHSGRTRTVLAPLIARQVPDAFFVEVLQALDGAAARKGRTPNITSWVPRSIDRLEALLRGEPVDRPLVITPALVARESTAAVGGGAA